MYCVCTVFSPTVWGLSQHCMEMCHDDLSLFPYKVQLSQPLLKAGLGRHYAFLREYGALLENSLAALNVMVP
jgi:hypothetical protein